MATSPLGGFANLSRYQQAAVQPQPNVLDQFVQALNQGISLAQLPQTLQAEAQQRQQNAILNAIKVATAQKQFEELNKTPEQRLAERFQDNLIAQSYDRASGVRPLSPDLLTPEQLSIFEGGVQLQAPGALTPQQQIALDEGGVRTAVPLGTPVAPVLTPRGVPTQFSFDPSIPAGIVEKARLANLTNIEAEELAKGKGKLPFEQAKIKAEEAAKGTKLTPLVFSTEGNKRIGRHPITGVIVSETIIPAGFVERQTDRGLFVGREGDAASFKLVPGTEPIPKEEKPVKLKTPTSTQVDQLAGLDLLSKKLDDLEKTPQSVRKSNVGWLDNLIGSLQTTTGLGKASTIQQNESFRNATDALVAEFSFGRGGKALTATEREILSKYLPTLTNSDAAFEARLGSFRSLIRDLKDSRLQALEGSGYDVSKFGPRSESPNTPRSYQNVTEAEARASADGLKDGDIVLINGIQKRYRTK